MLGSRKLGARKAERNFDRCQLKSVIYIPYAKEDIDCHPRPLNTFPKDTILMKAGFLAVLSCPRIESDSSEVTSEVLLRQKSDALKSVREEAGKIICGNCPYIGMSKLDVVKQNAAISQLEADKRDEYYARLCALSELKDRGFKLDPLSYTD